MTTELDLQAADLMEKLADDWESGIIGWCQWSISRHNTHTGLVDYCLLGGLELDKTYSNKITLGLRIRVNDLLRCKLSVRSFVQWNDMVERTKDDVIGLLKDTAKDIRNGTIST